MVLDQSPVSLSWAELDVEHHSVTYADPLTPRWVRAWVRFPETELQPMCEVVAWTDRAARDTGIDEDRMDVGIRYRQLATGWLLVFSRGLFVVAVILRSTGGGVHVFPVCSERGLLRPVLGRSMSCGTL